MRARVLLVEDDIAVSNVLTKALSAHHTVIATRDGYEAIECLRDEDIDVLVSDVSMPGMSGIDLLREVRDLEPDLPVVLITGSPDLDTAMSAIEYGVLRYLPKPLKISELLGVVDYAYQLHSLGRVRREVQAFKREDEAAQGGVRLAEIFDRTLESLWMAYQPIVAWPDQTCFGHEALLRSREPSLPDPPAVLDAAERLGRVHELGRVIRRRVAQTMAGLSPDVVVFVNLHPLDLEDDDLFDAEALLTTFASRVVLEVTERASLDRVEGLSARLRRLRDLGYRFAVDDLGAGYSGLTSFVTINPEIVKIDRSLVRGLDRDGTKQKLVASLLGVCRDMGIRAILEGVETRAERSAAVELGAELLQGYAFHHPEERDVPHWPV